MNEYRVETEFQYNLRRCQPFSEIPKVLSQVTRQSQLTQLDGIYQQKIQSFFRTQAP